MLHAPASEARDERRSERGRTPAAPVAAGALGIAPPMPGNQTRLQTSATAQRRPSRVPFIQRACACGGACADCQEKAGLQTKLAINEPGDAYEQEADRVAEQVMRMPAATLQTTVDPVAPLRRMSDSAPPDGAPSIVGDVLGSSGAPLDAGTRAFMEPRFGRDFGDVRVHTGPKADEAAASVHARAFTVGRDLVFAAGEHDPGSERGRRLMAHELTHVVQQSGNAVPPRIQRDPPDKPALATCNLTDVFTELDPGAVVPSAYFRNGNPLFGDKKQSAKEQYKSELAAAKKGNCTTEANFPSIKLQWDLGNPKLKSWWTININKDSHSFDINNQLIYSRNPCCSCFTGTLTWSFDVSATREFDKGKPTAHTETGKTAAPLKGTKTTGSCAGTECCSISKTFPMSLWLGDASDGVSIDFTGSVTLSGKILEKKA
ncbi:MAG TPA: DUF4157 domain-containing protein [Pseudolabrys sp.]|nr:DUF4157 domain-containing protein [Pseudolabrys sp.]